MNRKDLIYGIPGLPVSRLSDSLISLNMWLDREFAEFFEQYVIEGRGEKTLTPGPGVLGVVPVQGSLKSPQTLLSENVFDWDEASKLLDKLEEMGHIHLGFYGFTMGADSPQFVGTYNFCGDCCSVLHGPTHLGLSEAPRRSNYRSVKDSEKCTSCGTCVERCQVHAINGDVNGTYITA